MGRERELAQADEALQAALGGDVQVVLIGGDAGIGKTSLVGAVLDLAAARGFLTLEGHCLDTDTGIPLAPALEALRPLLAKHARSADRPVAGRISASTTPGVDDLRQLVAESVHHGPTLIAIEDMHWSDPSTRDLCLAMARSVRGALVIALTWRADDVTRRHPLRRVLVDLARAAGARRIDLGPLDRSDIARIVEVATGAAPDPSLVGALLARSEGNPLYVEELLAAKPDTVPGLLSDLLLAHVDALPGPTRELLRIAAVGGSRIDTDLLAAVSGLEPLTLESRLREAIDANVILRHGDSLDFRHGLLREAVYDDLLPGERTRLHGAYAGAMQARLDSGAMPPLMAPLGQLAFHWYAAHALPSTLAVSVRAGLVAKQFGAIEARTHLERALSLWDRVPDAEQVAGQAKPDVLRSLAEVVGEAGDADRPRALLREAAALLRPDGDPLLASRVYSTIAAQCYEYDDVIGQAEALDRALRYAQASPSPELSKALWTKGGYHWRHHQFEAALGASTSAIEVALAVGDLEGERRGRLVRGESLMLLGRTTEALEEIDRAGRLSERVGAISELVWTQVLTAWMTWGRGDPEPGPLALIRRTRASAERHEFGWLVCDCAEFEVSQLIGEGRLADADLLLHELEEIELPEWRRANLRSGVLLAQGEIGEGLALAREIAGTWTLPPWIPNVAAVVRLAELLEAAGDVTACLLTARDHLTAIEHSDSPLVLALAARLGFMALAAAQRARIPVPFEDLAARSSHALGTARHALTDDWRHGSDAVELLVASAYQRRLAGSPSLSAWRAAVDAAARFGPYRALRPRLELARDLLAAGLRDDGREELVGVWKTAREMGARWLEQEAVKDAHRARIPLPGEDEQFGPLTRLTHREREVLDLIAQGCTNRTIATRLFISEKTVSVHVTNVIAKLGVTNRGEAAALTHQTDASPPARTV